jgi:hypothetical protein
MAREVHACVPLVPNTRHAKRAGEGTMDMSQKTQETDAAYVLGHSAQELERLTIQARLYDPFTEQVFRDAGITAGMRVLDVGCGSGDVSFLAARLVGPTGEVVGRFVLMYNLNPSELLRLLAMHVRPGGLVVFQEPDWSGCRSLPPLPTWSRCWHWISASMQGSGAHPSLGLRLFATFTTAGLPSPVLWEHAVIASGPDHLLYAHAAEFVRILLPAIEQLGIATAGEIDVETLAARLQEEVVATRGTVVWASLVGAAAHRPAGE